MSDAVHCSRCGKRVSQYVTVEGDTQGLMVRAWIECPECIEMGTILDTDEDDFHEWASADRFRLWAGQGLPVAWARSMGVETAVVYPITDSTSCGVIDGGPKPEQVLCWSPSREKAVFVIDALRKEHDMDIRRR